MRLFVSYLSCGHSKIGSKKHQAGMVLMCYNCGSKGMGLLRVIERVEEAQPVAVLEEESRG